MDEVEKCPPWWPNIVWWLLNRPPKGPKPQLVTKSVTDATESLLVALHNYHGVLAIGPKQDDPRVPGRRGAEAIGPKQDDPRALIQRAAIQQMTEAVQQLEGAIKAPSRRTNRMPARASA